MNTLCQGEDGLLDQLALFQTYHNFVLPHASLRQPPFVAEATNSSGSATVGRSRTPAMAAGLPDHVWSLQEVWLFRVPMRPQPQVQQYLARELLVKQRGGRACLHAGTEACARGAENRMRET